MNHIYWHRLTQHDSQLLPPHRNIVSYTEPVDVNHIVLCWAGCVGIMVCYAELVVVYHCMLYWAGCVGIMVCYSEPLIVNHCVLCWPGCVGQMVCYAEPMVVNHRVLFCASRCEPWRVMINQWLWIILCYSVTIGVTHGELCHNHWFSITHHDSQSLTQHDSQCFSTTGSA
jgi:hypothetical protein